MLRIANLEEIQNLLLRVPNIVELSEQHDPNFVPAVKRWLTELETALKNNNLPVSANIASLRGNLISTDQGNIPAGINVKGTITKRKLREATATHSISQAVDIVTNIIQKDAERVGEAQRITRQLVAIAKSKGLITQIPNGASFSDMLKTVWKTMSTDQVLAQGVVSVEGLLAQTTH
ncbi:MAG: hypothetical protein WC325_00180 [Candidatus Bathyarchaeia archaeon]|jgi:hypothetical protein